MDNGTLMRLLLMRGETFPPVAAELDSRPVDDPVVEFVEASAESS